MNFKLTREQQLVQQMVREFAVNEVKPIAAEIDETERFPMENVEKMAKLGMMGIPFSKEFGGAGGDVLSYIIAVEELSKVCGTTGVILSAHTSLCATVINENGTNEQRAKYLPDLCSGKKIGAFGLTEPGAGTDSGAQQTTAVLEGDHYVLNGSKIFITNGGVAETFIIFAMTDKSKGTKGVSGFIVEKSFPGFSIGKIENKMGIRASSTTELVMEDCIVPKENLLSVEGKGFGIAMKTLDGGRIGIAAQALGIAEGAFEEAVNYMKERKQFGKPLSAFQGLQWYIAEMDVKIQAAKYLVYLAATKKQ
ncbi:acyl-CoA dehydrogenase, partial [Clostridium beijerinckii]